MKSVFEDLPNEIMHEIFEYLDLHHVYNEFLYLNDRFEYLLFDSSMKIKCNTPSMPKSNFENYYRSFIIPNQDRIHILRLSNSFIIDIVFSPPRMISEFIRLETLILDNINTNSLYGISQELMSLTNLHSLTLNIAEYVDSSIEVYSKVFLLSKLKFCKIKYRIKTDYNPLPNCLSISPIEHLIINARFPLDSIYNLIDCLPKLRRLSVHYIVYSSAKEYEPCPENSAANLTHIYLKLDLIYLKSLEKIIKNFFRNLEILTISTNYDEEYLDANRWEHLISSYMPKLRLFDIKHDGCVPKNAATYDEVINHFSSSFWITKKWFFTHHHNSFQRVNSGTFYSIKPYRRNDFTFNWQLDQQQCPYVTPANLQSVKYVYVCGIELNHNRSNYFPNAIQLTIEQNFPTFDHPLNELLNRIAPLNKITKLIIKNFQLYFEQLLQILCSTSSLTELKIDYLCVDNFEQILFRTGNDVKHISRTNKVKMVNLVYNCTLEKTKLIVELFPKLEYLKIGIENKQIKTTLKHMLLNILDNASNLYYLCITDLSLLHYGPVIETIETKILPNHYRFKFLNRDLYLWW